jgi:hypothetical protein
MLSTQLTTTEDASGSDGSWGLFAGGDPYGVGSGAESSREGASAYSAFGCGVFSDAVMHAVHGVGGTNTAANNAAALRHQPPSLFSSIDSTPTHSHNSPHHASTDAAAMAGVMHQVLPQGQAHGTWGAVPPPQPQPSGQQAASSSRVSDADVLAMLGITDTTPLGLGLPMKTAHAGALFAQSELHAHLPLEQQQHAQHGQQVQRGQYPLHQQQQVQGSGHFAPHAQLQPQHAQHLRGGPALFSSANAQPPLTQQSGGTGLFGMGPLMQAAPGMLSSSQSLLGGGGMGGSGAHGWGSSAAGGQGRGGGLWADRRAYPSTASSLTDDRELNDLMAVLMSAQPVLR